jgi:hypothetical protein
MGSLPYTIKQIKKPHIPAFFWMIYANMFGDSCRKWQLRENTIILI